MNDTLPPQPDDDMTPEALIRAAAGDSLLDYQERGHEFVRGAFGRALGLEQTGREAHEFGRVGRERARVRERRPGARHGPRARGGR